MRRRLVHAVAVLVLGMFLLSPAAVAQQNLPPGSLVIKVLAEKKVLQVPNGPLFWRIENYPTLAEAQAAAGLWGLAAESGGKVWLVRLGPAGGSSAGGRMVAEIGPLPPVVAPEFLLRLNEPSGPPGSITIVHSHPGAEAVYVLAGELCMRTPHGTIRVTVGGTAPGHAAGTPMQVSSCGSTDLRGFVMFVVDATKPFSSPAAF